MHPATHTIQLLGKVSEGEQLQLIADWFSNFASSNYGVHINSDFLQLSLSASPYLNCVNEGKWCMVWLEPLEGCAQMIVTPDSQQSNTNGFIRAHG